MQGNQQTLNFLIKGNNTIHVIHHLNFIDSLTKMCSAVTLHNSFFFPLSSQHSIYFNLSQLRAEPSFAFVHCITGEQCATYSTLANRLYLVCMLCGWSIIQFVTFPVWTQWKKKKKNCQEWVWIRETLLVSLLPEVN